MHGRLPAARVQMTRAELVDPDLRAALGRRNGEVALRRLPRLDRRDPGRRALGVPDLVEGHAVLGDLAGDGHGSVRQDDRDAVGRVPRDDAPRCGAHAWHSIGPPWNAT